MRIALDATYSIGAHLSGVGVYSRELLTGISSAHPEASFVFCYRPHRFVRSLQESMASNCSRAVLLGSGPLTSRELFHGLNQRLPRSPGKRSVCTFHDLFVMSGEYSTPEFRVRFAAQAREAAERATLIIAVSEFTGSQVRDLLGVEASRIRVVPHGVHLPAGAPQAAKERVILHTGAIQHRKNIVRLVEAFEQCPAGWKLILAGSSGYRSEEIFQRIEQSRKRDSIKLASYVSGEQLHRLYQRASILAFPSLDEGFGMPVLEAMAHGAAVVTSKRSALPEVAGDAALLVDPLHTDEIAGALTRLMEDETLRESLVRKGYERAAEFPWRATVEKTWSCYREIMGTEGRLAPLVVG